MGALPATQQTTARKLTGAEKVAALLLVMGRPTAARLLKHFDATELRQITRSAADLGSVPAPAVESLVEEFGRSFLAGIDLLSSAGDAQQLLADVLPPEQIADIMSVILTHLSETIRSHLADLLSYRDMRMLLERLEPEYRKLLEEICPAHLSYSGLQSVLKLLLAERVSIRNLDLVLEAVAEIAPHARRAEQIAEHVRVRLAPQICGDLSKGGMLEVFRLGARWDLAFQQAIRRDQKGEIVEFDMDPKLVEQFGEEAAQAIRGKVEAGHEFVLLAMPEARNFVRMIVERGTHPVPVLSHLEIARGVKVRSIGSIS